MRKQDDLNDAAGGEIGPAERELETALRTLSPAPARVDAIGASFAAGRRAGRGEVRLWRGAAAVMLLALVGSWLIPPIRSGSHEPPGHAPVLAVRPTPPPAAPPPAQSLIMLDRAVREGGLDALPEAGLPAVQLVRPRDRV